MSVRFEALTQSTAARTFSVFNIINDTTTTWSSILPYVTASYDGPPPSSVIDFSTWVKVLEASADADSPQTGAADDPPPGFSISIATKRGSQTDGDVTFDTEKAKVVSEKMRTLPPESYEWIRVWLLQWGFQPLEN